MRQSWQVRLTSAFLAALMAGSTCVEPVLAVEQIPVQESAGAGDSALVTSEGTLNVSGMDEDAINAAVEQYLSEQLGVDGTLTVEPRDESGIGAGSSVDGVDAGSVPADPATDSGIGTDTGADGAGDSTAASPDITITDVTTTEDGLVTVTDSNGNSVTVDEENRSIEATVSIPDAEDAGALSYNKNDEDALEGYEYLGTNTENGAAYYRRQISRSDLPPVDSDAAAREAAEDAAFTEWYHAETISGDAIDQALEQAAAFDSYV